MFLHSSSFCIVFISLYSIIPINLFATSTSISHRIQNMEIEIEMLKKNNESQEEARAVLEQDIRQSLKNAKNGTEKNGVEIDKRIQAIEKTVEKSLQDMKEFRNHANSLGKRVEGLHEQLLQIEKKMERQSTTIEHLEKALRSLTMAFKGEISAQKREMHTVEKGESLEKIAKKYKSSIQEIKELNELSSNTIRVGQELHIPISKE